MTPAAKKLKNVLVQIYSPIDRRTVSEWCEDELHLSARQSPMPGPFSLKMTPYLREPINSFGNVDTTDIVMVFGTQTGKTTAIMAGTAWRVVQKPQPVVWVMPTENLAKSFCDTRWIPLCEDSPVIFSKFPKERHRIKKLEQHFAECSVIFAGSNSPANLASRPAGLLVMDEVDKFADATAKESSALYLAESRTKSFADALRVKTSTPTIPEGPIWQEFLKGTQEKYYLPCPHCEEMITLEWENLKWLGKKANGKWDYAEVEKTAHYECPKCRGKISDGDKIRMLQQGRWVASNTEALSGFRSFHLNSLYAPWRSCTFGSLAVKYLQNNLLLSGKQDFYNSVLALPFEYAETSVGDDDILSCRGDYLTGVCPFAANIMLVGADVGQDKTHWVVVAFGANGEMAVVDYGVVLSVDGVLPLKEKTYLDSAGKSLAISGGLIDSGYNTYKVYSTCKASNNFYHAAKGVSLTIGARITENAVQDYPGVVLYLFSDHAVKTELFLDRVKRQNPCFLIPKDSNEELIKGLSGQRLVVRKTINGKDYVWKSVANDHFMDAIKLAFVGYKIITKRDIK